MAVTESKSTAGDGTLPPWIVIVPFPALGHVTPMVHLARALHSCGSFRPVIAVPSFIHRLIFAATAEVGVREDDGVAFASIPDGLEAVAAPDFSAIEDAMENHMPTHLEALITNLGGGNCGGGGVACVVFDLLASWAIQVARRCSVPVAGFWPAMLATYRIVSAIPQMVQRGLISEYGIPIGQAMLQDPSSCVEPELTTQDLPWLVGNTATQKLRFKFWSRILGRSRSLRWLIVNSFSAEDYTIQPPPPPAEHSPCIFQVAPLMPDTDHQNKGKQISFGDEDRSCLDWLDKQKPFSVIYVSFGSWVGPVGEEKVAEMALGLEATGMPFLWVLGDAWRKGLPVGYLENINGRGKLVRWAPQKDVLRHEAVACHLTHCGWNSTMESIQCGKGLICYPISGDQFVNCGFIVSVWKIGMRLELMERRSVEDCVKKVMSCGEDVRRRVFELRELMVGEEGRERARSSLECFVTALQKFRVEEEGSSLMSSL